LFNPLIGSDAPGPERTNNPTVGRTALVSAIDQELRQLIQKHGRITFAQFMQTCLYSPNGGFYSSRAGQIDAHFGTSATSHPAFGTLIVRQLEQMWHLLGDPSRFAVVEVGSGDGSLARSIVEACNHNSPGLSKALDYVATDYEPWWPESRPHPFELHPGAGAAATPDEPDSRPQVQRVKAEGLGCFQGIVGCILCNELLDNFPVHRFAIQEGRVKEVFVTLTGDRLAEVLDEPSTPRIEARLSDLGVSLPEGARGEVNLAMEGWASQLADSLDRGFVLTIDYGQLARDLYSSEHPEGTMVCYQRHAASADPYEDPGGQDITTHVDFTSLMRLGEQSGLATVGYTLQRNFLVNLGFSSVLDVLEAQDLSEARIQLARMAMMTLVDPEEYGDFKVLTQAKGMGPGIELLGFKELGT
jgi:SAM-dependent MidA family methyltransferase